ncbi:hypothetical protein [Actinoplanes sp. NPDC026670]|uniref:hypothetical protein n=1 Tax=Actinoplanes sp. NPDC026670 TaxID=3154700 RepID=UPI0033FB65B8
MAYPSSLRTVVVRGRFITHPDGTPAKGNIKIVNAYFVQGPGVDMILTPFEAKAALDATGSFSLTLPATDDPDWTPAGWTYAVTAMVNGKSLKARLALAHDGPAQVDLADVLNAEPVDEAPTFYLVASLAGAPGGVAQLGADGKVPAAQLPDVLAGEVAWPDVTGKPESFPPAAHSHAYGSLIGTPSSFPPAPHSHAQEQITGLTEALASKVDDAELEALVDDLDEVHTELRAGIASKADAGHSHSFASITGKPATYPHATIQWSEIEGRPNLEPTDVTWDDVQGKPTAFPPAAHGHATSEVTGLDAALADKASTGHSHAYADITGKPSTFTPAAHGHATSEVTGLDAALAAKADASALSAYATTSSVTTSLAGKANSSHTHAAGDIGSGTLATARGGTGLSTFTASSYLRAASTTALEFRTPAQVLSDIGAAASSHTHTASQITDLSTTLSSYATTSSVTSGLAGKANTSHTHTRSQITDIGPAVIVLGPSDAVPAGTAAGTVIIRRAS